MSLSTRRLYFESATTVTSASARIIRMLAFDNVYFRPHFYFCSPCLSSAKTQIRVIGIDAKCLNIW
jgi:hypothetical protein